MCSGDAQSISSFRYNRPPYTTPAPQASLQNIWNITVLDQSYLHDRYQVVAIDGELSDPVPLEYGVPQGSVLGPKEYIMYTKPLANIMEYHRLGYHFYADDTQVYISFKSSNVTAQNDALQLIGRCMNDIVAWMHKNMLKLNNEKTEFIFFHTKHKVSYTEPSK